MSDVIIGGLIVGLFFYGLMAYSLWMAMKDSILGRDE